MSSVSKKHWCEVYVWLGRDEQGKVTTASSGGMKSEPWNLARCGHASLGIFDGTKVTYVSLWPAPSGAKFVQSLEQDQNNEGGRPDAIVRLHHLDVPRMLRSFGEIQKKAQGGKIRWVAEAANYQDVTDPNNTDANCASCVYAVLKTGGLTDASSDYSKYLRGQGPKDQNFYNKVRCNAGMRAGGKFDGFSWTDSWFTPKGLLLRVASAAEAYFDDKNVTTQIMDSLRVATDSSVQTGDKKIAK